MASVGGSGHLAVATEHGNSLVKRCVRDASSERVNGERGVSLPHSLVFSFSSCGGGQRVCSANMVKKWPKSHYLRAIPPPTKLIH
jgi:hypothetical protein